MSIYSHTDFYAAHLHTLVVRISDPLTLADSTLCSLFQCKERSSDNEARMECLGNNTAGIWPEPIKMCVCVCTWAEESNKCMSLQPDIVLGSCTFNIRAMCEHRHRPTTV